MGYLLEGALEDMKWNEVRQAYPNQWLVVEAIEAHNTIDQIRKPDRLAVVETCTDGNAALQSYRRLHQQHPQREFYFVHTSRELLDIHELQWLGVRFSDANPSKK